MKEGVEITKILFDEMCSLLFKAINLEATANLTGIRYITTQPMFLLVQKLAWCTSTLAHILTLPKISRLEQACTSALTT